MTKFKAGTSGNPAGRPRGAMNKTTLAVQNILAGEGEVLARKAVELALAGDTVALRLCLERIAPARKDSPITFKLPKGADLGALTRVLLEEVAAGRLTPREGEAVAKLVAAHAAANDVAVLETRLAALEQAAAQGGLKR